MIEAQVLALVTEAVSARERWTNELGECPDAPVSQAEWFADAVTVAAYRDRYEVTSYLPVGGGASNEAQAADR